MNDFADDISFVRNSKLLHQLYIRGRHSCISTITATQVFKQISPIIRKNVLDLFVFRLRNQHDLDAMIEEVSAVASKKEIFNMYKQATDEPYGFLYISLTSKTIEEMFFNKFNKLICS